MFIYLFLPLERATSDRDRHPQQDLHDRVLPPASASQDVHKETWEHEPRSSPGTTKFTLPCHHSGPNRALRSVTQKLDFPTAFIAGASQKTVHVSHSQFYPLENENLQCQRFGEGHERAWWEVEQQNQLGQEGPRVASVLQTKSRLSKQWTDSSAVFFLLKTFRYCSLRNTVRHSIDNVLFQSWDFRYVTQDKSIMLSDDVDTPSM